MGGSGNLSRKDAWDGLFQVECLKKGGVTVCI